MTLRSPLAVLVPLALMLLALPPLGVVLAGEAVSPYLEFPPIPRPARHAPFSQGAFLGIVTLIVVCVAPFVYRVAVSGTAREPGIAGHSVPWWGWFGAVLLASSWTLAWNRFPWFAPFQAYTFSPIWLGYILSVNALCHRRTGRCMLTHRTGYFLVLFPVSAVFWWLFEFLNRFVQNWHYVGVPGLDPWQYFWQATLAFATVLPAVLGTRDLLASWPRLDAGLDRAWRVRVASPRRLAVFSGAASAAILICIGVWPQFLFPMLWLAPLVALASLQGIRGEPTLFAPLGRGDWRELWRCAVAALICGVLWEMWNYHSLAHWEYTIPYVHGFELFHMPLPGYAGYLPFGWQCLAVAGLLDRCAGLRSTRA